MKDYIVFILIAIVVTTISFYTMFNGYPSDEFVIPMTALMIATLFIYLGKELKEAINEKNN